MPVTFDFSTALNKLKNGEKVTNTSWNNQSGMYLEMQVPDKNSKMTVPYILFNIPCNEEKAGFKRVPYYWPSNHDLFSEEWIEIDYEKNTGTIRKKEGLICLNAREEEELEAG